MALLGVCWLHGAPPSLFSAPNLIAGDNGLRRRGQAVTAATGAIRGRVTDQRTGEPLASARVTVTEAGRGTARLALTDASGWFGFSGLPAGRFVITAAHSGYVTRVFGEREGAPNRAVPVDLGNGATFSDAHVQLPRGGVIAGRLTDEMGDPVIDVPVSVGVARGAGRQRRFVVVGSTRTDDQGEYRIWGLDRGEVLCAVEGVVAGPA